jgi:hypothetical protein
MGRGVSVTSRNLEGFVMIPNIVNHAKVNNTYSLRDLHSHLADKGALEQFAQMVRDNGHKPLKQFVQTSNDWQAMVAPALLSPVADYGLVPDLPSGLVTTVNEERESVTKRFVWKAEPVEDYLEGQPFAETYFEGATNVIRWRKPGAKLAQTREAAMDLPLNVMQMNVQLTVNEFKAREWKHFMHELHKATSNAFEIRATTKNGEELDVKWRELFDNAYTASADEYATWDDIKAARAAMLRRERDAVRPTVCIINATTEASLSDSVNVNNAMYLGNAESFFRTGSLPNIYQLTFVVVPDAYFGYFTNDVTRKNDTFVQTNDVFLIATNNGPTIIRHTREPLSTETWRIEDGQKEAINMWERYEYSVYRHTNVMRIEKPLPPDEYGAGLN